MDQIVLPHGVESAWLARSVQAIRGSCEIKRDENRQLTILIERLRRAVLAPPAASERFHVAFLDRGHAYLGGATFGTGRSGGLSLRLRDLFVRALSVDARSLILAHNHPSGDCRPSVRDRTATQRLGQIAQALDIELVDHLIFTESAVYSMRGRGEL
ncbi:MAG: JAB domain-containing protein [Erythrobacter sp.]|uniref:JAB domain-containing protein n=1 Tax=Erythrobacter sp. TaxID=1042 RepID=UPI002622B2AD|nr:JAB domain-containing protein [Erythrobacter sp.]MDJ0979226.1 JAB domain-containing protein [Erythrobacter sp.]